MSVTNKYERICVQCVKNGGIAPQERIVKNENTSLKTFTKQTGKVALEAASEEVFGSDDDNEDLDESDADEDV